MKRKTFHELYNTLMNERKMNIISETMYIDKIIEDKIDPEVPV